MRVNGTTHINSITIPDLIAEARTWGIPMGQARNAVSSISERFDAALGGRRRGARRGWPRTRSFPGGAGAKASSVLRTAY